MKKSVERQQAQGNAEQSAKKIHVARAVDYRGIELGKDCVFYNDREGLTKLVTWMKALQQGHQKKETLDREILQKRLILSLYDLGTITCLNRIT
ncbi:MAG: hypothetical protein WD469_08965 [Paenibacillaceae bacterium]